MKRTRLIILSFLLFSPLFIYPQEIGKIGEFQRAAAFSIINPDLIYVLDKGTSEVIKIDSTGREIKKIGGTGWDDYTFDNPVDLCATILRVYITDKNNSRIQVYDKDLNFLFSLDPKNFTQTQSLFKYPVSAQASNFGDLYVADSDNKQIIRFNATWEFVNSFGGYSYGKFAVADPIKLAVDNNSSIYLIDGKRILVYDQFGNGIASYNLSEIPVNLHIQNNIMTVVFGSYLLIAPVNGEHTTPQFKKYSPKTEASLIDAIEYGDRIYILTENSISIYNRDSIEQKD